MVMVEPRYRAWAEENASCELSKILQDFFEENCSVIERKTLFHNLIGRMVWLERKAEKAKKLFDILLLGRMCLCGQVADVLHFRPTPNGKLLAPH